MNIAITGGGGFIGRALALRLAGEGNAVRALDDGTRGDLASIEDHPGITRQHCDVLNTEELNDALRDVEAVFHLAAINGTENFYRIPARVLEVGVIGTHNVLKASLRNNVAQFYLASSSEVYETPPVIPTPETVRCSISDVFNPRYSYSGGKIAGELLTINYLRDTDVRWAIFRPHNVYGPQMGFEHVVPQLARKVFEQIAVNPAASVVKVRMQGSGLETRAFIYIDDAVRAIEIGTLGNPEGGIIHVGVERETSIRELVQIIGNAMGVDVDVEASPTQAGSPSRRCPDTRKLRGLGFEAGVSLEDGVAETVRWYDEHFRGTAPSAD